jgi:hypothetical protein
MVLLRVVRHDRHEQVLAECESVVIPARGEVLQLDTLNASNGSPLSVNRVEGNVLPDVSLVPEFAAAAERVLSESKM